MKALFVFIILSAALLSAKHLITEFDKDSQKLLKNEPIMIFGDK